MVKNPSGRDTSKEDRALKTIAASIFAISIAILIPITANGAVTCDPARTSYDSEDPQSDALRPHPTGDFKTAFYTSHCVDTSCQNQNGGNLYKANLLNGTRSTIVAGTSSSGCNHVSVNADGTKLAASCSGDLLDDLTGDAAISSQVYILTKTGNGYVATQRLTAHDNGMNDLKPEIYGNTVCWVSFQDPVDPLTYTSRKAAYCDDISNANVPVKMTSGTAHTHFFVPGPDGKFLTNSRQLLDPDIPSFYEAENVQYFDGTEWHMIVHVSGGSVNAEPMFAVGGTKIIFVKETDLIDGSADPRRAAWVCDLAPGTCTKIFTATTAFNVALAQFVVANSDLTEIVVSSSADLDGGTGIGWNIYSCAVDDTGSTGSTGSPVDQEMRVDDIPACNKTFCIPECQYIEYDIDMDGELNDSIRCDPYPAGDITYAVMPDGTGGPTSTYHQRIAVGGEVIQEIFDQPVPPSGSEDTFTAEDVPPPIFPILLKHSKIQASKGGARIKATFEATDLLGSASMTISVGPQSVVIDLGDTNFYRQAGQSLHTILHNPDGSILAIRFKKIGLTLGIPRWSANISVRRLPALSLFGGTDDINVVVNLVFGGQNMTTAPETFDRRPNGDLRFKP